MECWIDKGGCECFWLPLEMLWSHHFTKDCKTQSTGLLQQAPSILSTRLTSSTPVPPNTRHVCYLRWYETDISRPPAQPPPILRGLSQLPNILMSCSAYCVPTDLSQLLNIQHTDELLGILRAHWCPGACFCLLNAFHSIQRRPLRYAIHPEELWHLPRSATKPVPSVPS